MCIPESSGVSSCLPLPQSGVLSVDHNKVRDPLKEDSSPGVQQPALNFSVKLKDGWSVRDYQRELAQPGIEGKNYIIVAPTGSGKTLVSALIISDHLQKRHDQQLSSCHVAFIASTRLLAEQQMKNLAELLPAAKVNFYTRDTNRLVAESIKLNNITVCTAGKLLSEIKAKKVQFYQFSLMIFDECHHTQKNHPYAELMECYLEQRDESGNLQNLPQVIGMTASPGAGDNPNLNRSKAYNHLLTLAARLDTTSGIKLVSENREELKKCLKSSSFKHEIIKSRDPDHFIAEIRGLMSELEQYVDMKCSFLLKWSQEYEARIQQLKLPLEFSTDPKVRDKVSTLNLLRCCYKALNAYMNLQQSDAIEVLEKDTDFKDDDTKATPHEIELKDKTKRLIKKLNTFCPKNNPLLDKLEEILTKTFRRDPTSLAILFVCTKKHAYSMHKWVWKNHEIQSLKISSSVIIGHSLETGEGMKSTEQQEVMKKFHSGEVNLLIATSVAEEGLDVPACNLVIRFQHVSSDIAKVQSEGRARAENSHTYSIHSSDSKKCAREIKNSMLILLVKQVLDDENLSPSDIDLNEKLMKMQTDIMEKRKQKAALKEIARQKYEPKDVKLKCKKCKEFACYGSDVYTFGDSTFHYVVPDPDFKKKVQVKVHEKPRDVIPDKVYKTSKIHCFKCDQDWGVMYVWPYEGHMFPVLKCAIFVFEINGQGYPLKKWSNAPFMLYPLSTYFP